MRTSPTSSPSLRRPDKRVVVPIAIVAIVAGLVLGGAVRLLTTGDAASDGASGSPNPPTELPPTAVPPTPAPTGTATPSGAPTGPATSPDPSPGPSSTLPPATLPVRADAELIAMNVSLAPAPDGGVFVAVPASEPDPGEGPVPDLVVVRLDRNGAIRPGWPVLVRGFGSCWQPLAAADGTLRVHCGLWPVEDGLGSPVTRILGIDGNGRPLPGWPVEIDGSAVAAMHGNDVVLKVSPYYGDVMPDDALDPHFVARIGPTGAVERGREVELACCPEGWTIGSDGTVHAVTTDWEAASLDSRLTTFGLEGLRAGSPLDIEGMASEPAIDPAGRAVVFVRGPDGATNRLAVVDRDGRLIASHPLPGIVSSPRSAAELDLPGAPFLAGGTAFIVEDVAPGTRVVVVSTGNGSVLGSPYRSALDRQEAACEPYVTGCQPSRVAAASGQSGVLYLAHAALGAGSGGSIVAIDGGGRVIDGWPVGLRRAGAEVWSLATAPDGTVWALVFEPEGRGHSATVLAIAPDSTVRGTLTILEP